MRARTKRLPVNSSRFAMAFLFIVICGPLRAEEGTLAQRRACEPDVFRLCNEFIPDHAATPLAWSETKLVSILTAGPFSKEARAPSPTRSARRRGINQTLSAVTKP